VRVGAVVHDRHVALVEAVFGDVAFDAGEVPPGDFFAFGVEPLLAGDPERERHLVEVPGLHEQDDVVGGVHTGVELRLDLEPGLVLGQHERLRLRAGEGQAGVVDEERDIGVLGERLLAGAAVHVLGPAALVGAAVHVVALVVGGGVAVEVDEGRALTRGADLDTFDCVAALDADEAARRFEGAALGLCRCRLDVHRVLSFTACSGVTCLASSAAGSSSEAAGAIDAGGVTTSSPPSSGGRFSQPRASLGVRNFDEMPT
jgi:hypothetical protein